MDENVVVRGYTNYVTYVLQLEEGRWYVGRTQSLNNRLTAHWNGDGAKWTKVYSPVCLYALYHGDREQEMTEALIAEHGYQVVRGGDFCQEKHLNPKQVKRMINRIKQRNGLAALSATQVSELFTSGEVVSDHTAKKRQKRRYPKRKK
jgi:predicted GIY-YIG superfamily endonuclease